MNEPSAETPTTRILRILILGVFLLGTIGTGLELLLLEHTEDWRQLIPLVLFAFGLALWAGWALLASVRCLVAFRWTCLAFLVAGVAGIYYHYLANLEFELEMYPGLSGFELFWKAIHGAMPALAPGTMLQLGLLGLVYTFRHPALAPALSKESKS